MFRIFFVVMFLVKPLLAADSVKALDQLYKMTKELNECDVKLTGTTEGSVCGHRLVLKLNPVMATYLSEAKDNSISLPFEIATIEAAIAFIYEQRDSPVLEAEHVNWRELIEASNKFGLNEFKNKISKKLLIELSSSSAVSTYFEWAALLGDKELGGRVWRMLKRKDDSANLALKVFEMREEEFGRTWLEQAQRNSNKASNYFWQHYAKLVERPIYAIYTRFKIDSSEITHISISDYGPVLSLRCDDTQKFYKHVLESRNYWNSRRELEFDSFNYRMRRYEKASPGTTLMSSCGKFFFYTDHRNNLLLIDWMKDEEKQVCAYNDLVRLAAVGEKGELLRVTHSGAMVDFIDMESQARISFQDNVIMTTSPIMLRLDNHKQVLQIWENGHCDAVIPVVPKSHAVSSYLGNYIVVKSNADNKSRESSDIEIWQKFSPHNNDESNEDFEDMPSTSGIERSGEESEEDEESDDSL